MVIDKLNDMLIDVLREVGNIGSGNAATALSTMINKKVDMNVPQIKVLEFKEVLDVLGDAEEPVVGIYFGLEGDLEGNIMFVLDMESSKNLVNMLFGRTDGGELELNEMDMSALSEVGNILSASYANSLSMMTGLALKVTVPSICVDMAGAVISVPAIQFGITGDHAIFIETQFLQDENQIEGDIFLIPEVDSFEKLLRTLGVEM